MEYIQRITTFHFRGWLESLRLRTLPLAFASILTGSALAWWQGQFSLTVALLCFLTSGLLQVLSNLANDYGDAVKAATAATASARCAAFKRAPSRCCSCARALSR